MEWHGPGSRVLLLEKQGLGSGLKVKPRQGSNLPRGLPVAQSSGGGGHCPCLVMSIKGETGLGRASFHLFNLHALILFKITTLCGFWEKETSGRRGRLTLLLPVCECVLGPSGSDLL